MFSGAFTCQYWDGEFMLWILIYKYASFLIDVSYAKQGIHTFNCRMR